MLIHPLREGYEVASKPVPYKSQDQQAFEEAVTRPDAHTWLATQGLGYFNRADLHKHLIRGEVKPQPYLLKEPETGAALAIFEPSLDDVKEALADACFYHALKEVILRDRAGIPAVYMSAIKDSPYGRILEQELGESYTFRL